MAEPRTDCRRCRYHFVTWDEEFPKGCRAMGFKSRRFPSEEVRQAMDGEPCRLFETKQPPAASLKKPRL